MTEPTLHIIAPTRTEFLDNIAPYVDADNVAALLAAPFGPGSPILFHIKYIGKDEEWVIDRLAFPSMGKADHELSIYVACEEVYGKHAHVEGVPEHFYRDSAVGRVMACLYSAVGLRRSESWNDPEVEPDELEGDIFRDYAAFVRKRMPGVRFVGAEISNEGRLFITELILSLEPGQTQLYDDIPLHHH